MNTEIQNISIPHWMTLEFLLLFSLLGEKKSTSCEEDGIIQSLYNFSIFNQNLPDTPYDSTK